MYAYFNYYGPAESGKTTTLDLLRMELSKISSKHIVDVVNGTRSAFTINWNGTDHVVCVGTAGDTYDELHKNHLFFEDNKAEIMVTASHEIHLPYINVYVHAKIHYDGTKWSDKSSFDYHEIQSHRVPEKQQEVMNKQMAEYLFEQIKQTLSIPNL